MRAPIPGISVSFNCLACGPQYNKAISVFAGQCRDLLGEDFLAEED
jgi:hypothetical protein